MTEQVNALCNCGGKCLYGYLCCFCAEWLQKKDYCKRCKNLTESIASNKRKTMQQRRKEAKEYVERMALIPDSKLWVRCQECKHSSFIVISQGVADKIWCTNCGRERI